MENFIYSIPTTIYFGKGQIEHVSQAVRPYGKKALIVYGGGSVKKNGIFDRVTEILEHEGIAWEELGGVEPNPRIETVRKGAELCKAGNIEVVLPIGGGSTIDCAKIIAAGALYDGDAWYWTGRRSRQPFPSLRSLPWRPPARKWTRRP